MPTLFIELKRYVNYFKTLATLAAGRSVGACGALLQEGLRLLQDKDPCLALHRQIYPVGSRKYRTEQRREQLHTARFVLCVAETFYRTFGRVMFPRVRNAVF
jgi:hypothetical protein